MGLNEDERGRAFEQLNADQNSNKAASTQPAAPQRHLLENFSTSEVTADANLEGYKCAHGYLFYSLLQNIKTIKSNNLYSTKHLDEKFATV